MKILTCPLNGPRPLQEFVYGGVVRHMPDAAAATDRQWADYVFNRAGEPGVHKEWWYHVASGTWFIAERDHLKDVVICTYLYNRAEHANAGHTGLAASQADGNAEPGTDATGAQGGAEQA